MALVDTLDEQHHAGAAARRQQAAGARGRLAACTTCCSRRFAMRRPRAARAFAGPTIRACSTAPTRCGPPARSSATGAGGTCSTRPRSRDAGAAADGVSGPARGRGGGLARGRRSCAIAPPGRTLPTTRDCQRFARRRARRGASARSATNRCAIRSTADAAPCWRWRAFAQARARRVADVDAVGDARARRLAAHRTPARRGVRVRVRRMADGGTRRRARRRAASRRYADGSLARRLRDDVARDAAFTDARTARRPTSSG